MKHNNDCTQHHFSESEDIGERICDICGFGEVFILQQRIAELEEAASKFYWEWCEGSTEDEANAANELAALLPKGE